MKKKRLNYCSIVFAVIWVTTASNIWFRLHSNLCGSWVFWICKIIKFRSYRIIRFSVCSAWKACKLKKIIDSCNVTFFLKIILFFLSPDTLRTTKFEYSNQWHFMVFHRCLHCKCCKKRHFLKLNVLKKAIYLLRFYFCRSLHKQKIEKIEREAFQGLRSLTRL